MKIFFIFQWRCTGWCQYRQRRQTSILLTAGSFVWKNDRGKCILLQLSFSQWYPDIKIRNKILKQVNFIPFQWVTLACGAQCGFFCGDTRKLMDDVANLKPTIFIAVPRVLNRIYDKVSWLIFDCFMSFSFHRNEKYKNYITVIVCMIRMKFLICFPWSRFVTIF